MHNIDLLLQARWIAPVRPDPRSLEHHAIAVHEGRILEVLPSLEAKTKYSAETTCTLPSHLLIPGLVNTHTHASMALLRGYADDLPLMDWLQRHIWPAESRWVSDGFVQDGVRLAAAEMLRGGTTCFNDMYFFPDVTGRVASAVGLRAVVGLIVIDLPTVWAGNAEEYLAKGFEVHDQFRGDPLVRTAFAPHAPYSVDDGPLKRVAVVAEELDIPVHMHVMETCDEVEQSMMRHGVRPLARLQSLGLLTPRLVAVHVTRAEPEERAALASTGAHVVHCPESNMKLANGFCPVAELLDAGVNVALGTDGAASNNDLDMVGEMRTAALLGKAVSGSASALPAQVVLEMATLGGARALGMEELIGSLEAGKSADIVAVDLSPVESQPVYNPVSQLVYACGREQVSDVWIAGHHVLKDRQLTTLDLAAVQGEAELWRDRIKGIRR